MKPNTIVFGFYDNQPQQDALYTLIKKEKLDKDPKLSYLMDTFLPMKDRDTQSKDFTEIEYVQLINDALRLGKNVCITRHFNKVSHSQFRIFVTRILFIIIRQECAIGLVNNYTPIQNYISWCHLHPKSFEWCKTEISINCININGISCISNSDGEEFERIVPINILHRHLACESRIHSSRRASAGRP